MSGERWLGFCLSKTKIVEGVPALFETRREPKKPEESTAERLYSEKGGWNPVTRM